MKQLRRVRWKTATEEEKYQDQGEGWLHQFIAISDGDNFITAAAIVELDDGTVKVLTSLADWYILQFVGPIGRPPPPPEIRFNSADGGVPVGTQPREVGPTAR